MKIAFLPREIINWMSKINKFFSFSLLHQPMEAQEHPHRSGPARSRAVTRPPSSRSRPPELCQRPGSRFRTPSTARPRSRQSCSHPPRQPAPVAGLTPRPRLPTDHRRLRQAGAAAATAVSGFRRRALTLRATPWVTADPAILPTIGWSRRRGRGSSNIRRSRRQFLRQREAEEVRYIINLTIIIKEVFNYVILNYSLAYLNSYLILTFPIIEEQKS